jgi:hypothetical protein
LQSQASANYKNGYIITLKGDTIKGFLLFQNGYKATKQCVFKENLEGETAIYKPNEISGYRFIDGKFYISKQLPGENNQQPKTVFLEYFIKGLTSIYYLIDDKGEHYYIEKTPFGLIELSEPIKINEGTNTIIPSKYKGKLRSLMSDCPNIENEIDKTKLNYTSLVSLVQFYHHKVCNTDSCIIFERKPIPVKLQIGFLVGISADKLKFGNELISSTKFSYQFGLSMKINNLIFSDNNKINLNIDFLFGKETQYILKPLNAFDYLNYNGIKYILDPVKITATNNYNTFSELPVKLNILSFKFPIIVNYKLRLKNITLSTGIGINNKIILNRNEL